MSLTIDGNNLVFDGTVTITNFTNPTNGVCTLTLTPSGGVGTLPALLAGQPGQSPIFDSVSVTTLAAGSQATVGISQVSPGSAGVSSHYTLSFGIPTGATGATGVSTIGGASDLSGSPAVGNITYVSGVGPTAFTYTAMPFGNVYNATSFTSASKTGAQSAVLASISVPAQPAAWIPWVSGYCIVNGTVSTVVTLSALLNNSSTGNVLGSLPGTNGQAIQRLQMQPAFGSALGSGYGKVAANTSCIIYLVATETAAVTDNWSINATSCSFTVATIPVSFT